MMYNKIVLVIVSLLFALTIKSQVVLQPITSSVYEFLDEMAQMKYIELNSAVKPYSRAFIAQRLQEIEKHQEELNKRQEKELAFYFQDFNKELKNKGDFKKRKDVFFYKDSLFTITANPILGYQYQKNSTGKHTRRFNGGEFYGYIGDHFGFSASLRDNGISNIITDVDHINLYQGGNFKPGQGTSGSRTDYSEALGAIYYSWKWGRVGAVKDNFTWGDNYHGANIRSNKAPSVGYLDFNLKPTKWLELNYTHSWLVSEILDSARIFSVNNEERKLFTNKNLAANLITIKPFKNLHFSVGNSIVYADDGVQPVYLIPFIFYKSVDQTNNGAGSNALGQNAQMFFNISSRQIKHVHLYASMFIDEISIGNFWDNQLSSNIFSTKFGIKVNNFPVRNTYFIAEYTRNNPWTYRHQIESTTYESNQYLLGNYLGENAEEIYLEGGIRIIRGLKASLSYTLARKGNDHIYELLFGVANIRGLPFIAEEAWRNETLEAAINYEVINDGHVFLRLRMSKIEGDERLTPEFFRGDQTTISGGINFGF